ncbi:hypothetical protein [Gracilibacillus sp. HCP3S3_G5_2]|uniref:hypothetical protein n=1 Tax=Gracilibacillus sp. HCP3S3_G5_2 TaxID=3438941 RepID=UPI003F8BC7DD
MYTVIAYSSLIIAFVSVMLAIKGMRHYYWLAAFGCYLFSFLAGFSIGRLTVGLTFIPLALAIGYTFNWIQNNVHCFLFVCSGITIGLSIVLYVEMKWVFLPFWILS